jgi:hypothetical protein
MTPRQLFMPQGDGIPIVGWITVSTVFIVPFCEYSAASSVLDLSPYERRPRSCSRAEGRVLPRMPNTSFVLACRRPRPFPTQAEVTHFSSRAAGRPLRVPTAAPVLACRWPCQSLRDEGRTFPLSRVPMAAFFFAGRWPHSSLQAAGHILLCVPQAALCSSAAGRSLSCAPTATFLLRVPTAALSSSRANGRTVPRVPTAAQFLERGIPHSCLLCWRLRGLLACQRPRSSSQATGHIMRCVPKVVLFTACRRLRSFLARRRPSFSLAC